MDKADVEAWKRTASVTPDRLLGFHAALHLAGPLQGLR